MIEATKETFGSREFCDRLLPTGEATMHGLLRASATATDLTCTPCLGHRPDGSLSILRLPVYWRGSMPCAED